MDSKASPLFSEYVIDGVRQELTPAQIVKALSASSSEPSIPFPEFYSKIMVAKSLLDIIWRKGHFALHNLALSLDWRWNTSELGGMASFYSAVAAAADFIDSLSVRISSYSFREARRGVGSLKVGARVAPSAGLEDELDDDDVRMSTQSAQGGKLKADPQSWIIYIPFEHCQYRFGGSLLARSLSVTGSVPPQIVDADYFIDGYEVIRELVEDGIVKAGATVLEGGLMNALQGMAVQNGAAISVNDICRARGGELKVRVLFGEVPGVVLQIADIDFDYVDAEFILQDVAYYPLGHIVPGLDGLSAGTDSTRSIAGIVGSLIGCRAIEGED